MRSTFKVLFHVNGSKEKNGIMPTMERAIITISEGGTVNIPSNDVWMFEMIVIIALAFRLNTYEARRIRQKVLECLCQRKESGISILLSLGRGCQDFRN